MKSKDLDANVVGVQQAQRWRVLKRNLYVLIEKMPVNTSIIEFGVASGTNTFLMGEIISNRNNCNYYGFDTFCGYTQEDVDEESVTYYACCCFVKNLKPSVDDVKDQTDEWHNDNRNFYSMSNCKFKGQLWFLITKSAATTTS